MKRQENRRAGRGIDMELKGRWATLRQGRGARDCMSGGNGSWEVGSTPSRENVPEWGGWFCFTGYLERDIAWRLVA